MLRKLPVLLLPFVVFCPSISHGETDRPANYDECIVDAMKGVSSDVAARAIIDSCRNLYPVSPREAAPPVAPVPEPVPAAAPAATVVLPAPKPQLDTTGARELTAEELGRLSSKARVFGDSYRLKIENNNPGLTLTEVTIAVWDANDPATPRSEHSESVLIGPQETAEVKYTVQYRGDETGWSWGVVGARGVE